MSGEWSGGSASYTWHRPGSRLRGIEGDAERGQRIYAELAGKPFWCDSAFRGAA